MEERKWTCARCALALEPKKTVFKYLDFTFSHEVLACPNCGKIFISKDLADGRMAEVEEQLEDK